MSFMQSLQNLFRYHALNLIPFIISLLLFCNCSDKNKGRGVADFPSSSLLQLQKLLWLTGTWENRSEDGNLTETWVKLNDSAFSGKSFLIKDRDTLFSEQIKLVYQGNDLYYIPSVSDQNNGEQVKFKWVRDDAGQFVFENIAHDFPQRIIYTHPSPDSLHAWIEGIDKGKHRKVDFRMIRKK
jgi:hypothetical protein